MYIIISVRFHLCIKFITEHSASMKSKLPSSGEHENPIMADKTLSKLHAQKRGGNEQYNTIH